MRCARPRVRSTRAGNPRPAPLDARGPTPPAEAERGAGGLEEHRAAREAVRVLGAAPPQRAALRRVGGLPSPSATVCAERGALAAAASARANAPIAADGPFRRMSRRDCCCPAGARAASPPSAATSETRAAPPPSTTAAAAAAGFPPPPAGGDDRRSARGARRAITPSIVFSLGSANLRPSVEPYNPSVTTVSTPLSRGFWAYAYADVTIVISTSESLKTRRIHARLTTPHTT